MPTTEIDLAYYPGCTLSSTAREIDDALHQVCDRLDIHLHALQDWNCCGSSSIHAVRPRVPALSHCTPAESRLKVA